MTTSSDCSSDQLAAKSGQIIRQLAYQSFAQEERQTIKEAINNFTSSGSLITFIYALSSVCQKDKHFRLMLQIQKLLPQQLQRDYNSLCCMIVDGFSKYSEQKSEDAESISPERICPVVNQHEQPLHGISSSKPSNSKVSSTANKGCRPQCKTTRKYRTITDVIQFKKTVGNSATRNSSGQASRSTASRLIRKKCHTVLLFRNSNESLGMSIRGGREYSCGVYISKVEPDSQAERQGLNVGDRILSVNNTSFSGMDHQEAVSILNQASTLLELKVAPLSTAQKETELRADGSKESLRRGFLYEDNLTEIEINADVDGYLGCCIRGGKDMRRPVVISHVDRFSPSETAGLLPGDKLLAVNGTNVKELNHMDVVMLATSERNVTLTVQHCIAKHKGKPTKKKETVVERVRIPEILVSDHRCNDISTNIQVDDFNSAVEENEEEGYVVDDDMRTVISGISNLPLGDVCLSAIGEINLPTYNHILTPAAEWQHNPHENRCDQRLRVHDQKLGSNTIKQNLLNSSPVHNPSISEACIRKKTTPLRKLFLAQD